MKKVLAISGGVDSMLLLWTFRDDPDAIVAHFDHGTRPSSKDDAEFVQKVAASYGKKYYSECGNLGKNVSEAEARQARYQFLDRIAKTACKETEDYAIYTAHHLNDLVESVTINLIRGTGWRGLAPFSNVKIVRPFLRKTKREILAEAASSGIVFRQDPTNVENNYLRNIVREKIAMMSDDELRMILALYEKQTTLRNEIAQTETVLIKALNTGSNTCVFKRCWFNQLDDQTAMELLRTALERVGISATRPQIKGFLHAIRTYEPHKKFNLPDDNLVTLYKDYFML